MKRLFGLLLTMLLVLPNTVKADVMPSPSEMPAPGGEVTYVFIAVIVIAIVVTTIIVIKNKKGKK
ncbi:MAG: hypothetical protein K6E99_04295 [Bacilli bacterium]|nr:hypothetical protein [Bacilli bacterium]